MRRVNRDIKKGEQIRERVIKDRFLQFLTRRAGRDEPEWLRDDA